MSYVVTISFSSMREKKEKQACHDFSFGEINGENKAVLTWFA